MQLHRVFFYLLIFFLPTQLGYHTWPAWATVLGRRVDYLSPTLYFTDVLIFLTLISWFLGKKFPSIKYQLLIFIPFIALNILFSTNKPVTLFHWLKVFEFMLLAYYIVKTKPSFSEITTFLSIAILYSSVIAMLQFFLQHSMGGPLWFLGERTFTSLTPGIAQINWCIPNPCRLLLRPYATFPHPNVLGGFLAITLSLLINQLTNQLINQFTNKIFYLATILLGSITLILTFSRSAWIVGALMISIMMRKKSKIFLVIPFILAGALLLNGIDFNDESIVVRQELNSAAVTMWQHSPLFGVGLGNFLVKLPQTLPSRTVYVIQPVHNIYLFILTETGIVGFAMFLFLLWFVGKKNIFFMLPILLLGLVDHYFLTIQQGQLLFTLFLALALIK